MSLLTPQKLTDPFIAPLDFSYIFTSDKIARKELLRRRRDESLRTSVREMFSPAAAEVLAKCDAPRAILFRQVATPTHEILRFLKMARHMKLAPLILEYCGDTFVSAGNPYKRSLGKMPIYERMGSDGREIVKYNTVVDFNSYTGKTLSSVLCRSGEPLIEFHHSLLSRAARCDVPQLCVDATGWFDGAGGKAPDYYDEFLALFIRDAVLFEQFEPTVAEQTFTRDVFLPAFMRLEQKFGYKPLVVRLVGKNKEGKPFWDMYPSKIKQLLPA